MTSSTITEAEIEAADAVLLREGWSVTKSSLRLALHAAARVREDIPRLADTPPGRGEWFDLERRWRDKHDELRARAEKAELDCVRATENADIFAKSVDALADQCEKAEAERDAALAAYQPVSQSAAGAQELLGIGDEDGAIYGVHYGDDDDGVTKAARPAPEAREERLREQKARKER